MKVRVQVWDPQGLVPLEMAQVPALQVAQARLVSQALGRQGRLAQQDLDLVQMEPLDQLETLVLLGLQESQALALQESLAQVLAQVQQED